MLCIVDEKALLAGTKNLNCQCTENLCVIQTSVTFSQLYNSQHDSVPLAKVGTFRNLLFTSILLKP